MYIYSFDHYAGYDKLFILNDTQGIMPGDLFRINEHYYFALDDTCAFPENYTHTFTITAGMTISYRKLLTQKSIDMIHWMVYTHYSTYKSVMRLFIPSDIQLLLRHETTSKKKTGQQLIVFPDLWTLIQSTSEEFRAQPGVAVASSKHTDKQKNLIFRGCKTGKIHTLLTTHAEIFQDWKDLKRIVCVEGYKRYMQSMQDPRYKVVTVLEKMAEMYGATCEQYDCIYNSKTNVFSTTHV